MSAGDRARYANNAQVISWTDAAKRVGELIEAGQFGTQLENVEAPGTIRRKVAERLLSLIHISLVLLVVLIAGGTAAFVVLGKKRDAQPRYNTELDDDDDEEEIGEDNEEK